MIVEEKALKRDIGFFGSAFLSFPNGGVCEQSEEAFHRSSSKEASAKLLFIG
jgi:hypothetical protein